MTMVAPTIVIDGKSYLLSDVVRAIAAVPAIQSSAQEGKTVGEIVKMLEPAVAAIIVSLSNLFFPGLGTLESVILWAIKNKRDMTQEEETAWMNRFGTVDV